MRLAGGSGAEPPSLVPLDQLTQDGLVQKKLREALGDDAIVVEAVP